MTLTSNFRNAFYAGLLLSVIAGIYLLRLWQPERQVELHSIHLLDAIGERDWSRVREFIDAEYHDHWQHDRELLLARIRLVGGHTRDLRLEPHQPLVIETDDGPGWRARITARGEQGEMIALIKQHLNSIDEPFRLEWRQRSRKPWDWKLVHASNEALVLPKGSGF
ncbi:hypothetical protein BH18VER1_BH18VER1_03320 [soil metagenome]